MHQTTIRFDSELWRRIDAEARRIGVSAAQYIRDATLIRLTQDMSTSAGAEARPSKASAAISAAGVIGTESQAVWAQARQARERARALRDSSRRLAEMRAARPWRGAAPHGPAGPHGPTRREARA